MEIVEIEITDRKALKLLLDMQELNLIKVLKKKVNISSLRAKITAPMSNSQIDQQLSSIRSEWKRDI